MCCTALRALNFATTVCILLCCTYMSNGLSAVTNFTVSKDYLSNDKGPISILRLTWEPPLDSTDLTHYTVSWSRYSSIVQPWFQTSQPIYHNQSQSNYSYILDDIQQGQCYDVSIASFDGLGRSIYSPIITKASAAAVPYDLTFFPNGNEGKLTWKLQGNYSIDLYILEVEILPQIIINITILLDSSDSTEHHMSLIPGASYDVFRLFTYSYPECDPILQTEQPVELYLNETYTTAPPTPVNVSLSISSSSSLLGFVTWTMPNTFKSFEYIVTVNTSDGVDVMIATTNYSLDSLDPVILNFTSKNFLYWNAERYTATVLVVQDRTYSNLSLPSNNVTTVPSFFWLDEIQQSNGLILLTWNKPSGGDIIEDYLINCTNNWNTIEFVDIIPHMPGINSYEYTITTNNLTQAEWYDVTVLARNIAGSGPTPLHSILVLHEPIFNATVTNLTTMRVDWLPVEGTYKYLLVEYKSNTEFTSIVVTSNSTSLVVSDLTPYAEYTVYMYSAANSTGLQHGRSATSPKTVLMFTQEFCDESNVQHPDGITVKFPKTQAGYSNTSVDKCSADTKNGGTSLATRTCSIDVVWMDPVWLSSCDETLENLATRNISSDDDRESVAADLTVLTSNATSLTSTDIELSATALQSIVDTDHLYQNTTTLVVESIGNLLAAPEGEFAESGIAGSLLTTLNEVAAIVILDDDEEFQTTSSTLALSVVQTSKNARKLSGIGYFENINPSSDDLGFSESQFQIFNSNVTIRNRSSIWVPLEAVRYSQDGRVSFYAFLDNKIFQASSANDPSDDDNILVDSRVQSNIILSASVNGSVVENLEENVKITFNYTKASCPSDPIKTSEDCGDYLCGFWNELDSVWSRNGCTLIRISDDFVECQCNHLTNFATLFAYGRSESISNNFILDILTFIGSGLSLIGTIATIICLVVVRYSREPAIPKQTIFVMINLAFALTLLNGFLLISFLEVIIKNPTSCSVIAVFLHFSLLAALLWTSVEAVYICIGVTKPLYYRTELTCKKVCIASTLLGWGVPAIFVVLSAAINFSSYEKKDEASITCWIIPEMMLWLIIIPVAIILCLNTVVYIIVVKSYVTRKKIGDTANRQLTTGKSVVFSFTLFLIFGITWIFGFLLFDSNTANMVFAYIFTITNSLQGLFVFLLFVMRNTEIRQAVVQIMKDVTPSTSKLNSSSLNDNTENLSKNAK